MVGSTNPEPLLNNDCSLGQGLQDIIRNPLGLKGWSKTSHFCSQII